ncbi:RICIN domain-containing protein [Amycolatopsis sp. NPDC051128]|uniref:RICIN domain-containing protein n=1 Tax=Amycolatopsis sp. NPDC051128 TaxID=3155412 RepID=UPI003440A7E4
MGRLVMSSTKRTSRKIIFGAVVALMAAMLTVEQAQADERAQAVVAGCVSPGSLACLQITSAVSPGKKLDIENPGDPHSYLQLKADGGDRSFWKILQNPDFSFQMYNLASHNCVDVWRTNSYLDQWECVGQTSQRWHLVPYSSELTSFMIKQEDTGKCFTLDSADYIYVGDCEVANPRQSFQLGVSAAIPGSKNLATRYAMAQCDKNPRTCNWKEGTTKYPAYLGASKCVSQLVKNDSPNYNAYARTWTQTVGWENTVGGSVTVGVEVGIDLGIKALVKTEIQANYAHTWIGAEETSDTVTVNLKPQEYGWVTRAALLKKVVGTWTLDIGGHVWTQKATIVIPAADGTDTKLSTIVLKTGFTPPTDCAG